MFEVFLFIESWIVWNVDLVIFTEKFTIFINDDCCVEEFLAFFGTLSAPIRLIDLPPS